MAELTFEKLDDAVRSGAALRSRVTLQPAAGEGAKVFPPTYAGGKYATEKRRLPGYRDPVDCVLLDSVQSQANRMEEALQRAVDDGRIALPLIEVDFTPFFPGEDKDESLRLIEPVGKITSLQVPHRISDAILRDSFVEENGNKKPFRGRSEANESEIGKRLRQVTARNATPIFELCPTALLFGMWDSTGPKGGLGVKFERAMVGEIVGINAIGGVRTSSRIDPLGIQLNAGPVYQAVKTESIAWTLDQDKAEKEKGSPKKFGKDGKPSEVVHGNITPDTKDKNGRDHPGGFTITEAEQTLVLSFPALRRLHFPLTDKSSPEIDHAARTVLAALGLCAAALQAEAGLDLRSRCLLWPTAPLTWELLGKPGEIERDLTLETENAIRLLDQAVKAAKKVELSWKVEPVRLIPSDELVKLVAKSQELAVQEGAEGED